MSFILMAVLYLLASPNLVARDRPTVVVETYTKCTHRLDAFSCWADGESNSDSSRVAIPAGLLNGVLGTYITVSVSSPFCIKLGSFSVGLMSIVVKSESDKGVVNNYIWYYAGLQL